MKDELIKLYKLYKFYIFPTVVGFSSLILIIFIILPQTGRLISNQTIVGKIQNKSQFLQDKAIALESYDPQDLSRKVEYALISYPTEKDVVASLGLLQNITSQSGFSVSSITLGAGSGGQAKTQSYNIKLEVQGPTSLLPALLSNIESSPRLMKVETIETSITKNPAESTASLLVNILYAPKPTEFGTIDSNLPKFSEQDQEVIAKLANLSSQTGTQPTTSQLGPRGKLNPFE